jgi:ectoine hydroxylase-related dioxygenase (phytanoyl-CoA dioxygenase family)
METKLYGGTPATHTGDELSARIEEFDIQGYTVFHNLLNDEQILYAKQSLDKICEKQESEFGRDKLHKINELDLARCPFAYDDFFLHQLILHPVIVSFIKLQLGDYFLLHLQNGIINRPNINHHQSSWHRDLPYQNYVVSKPIAIGALFCLDVFDTETGGTMVLPFSHRLEGIPSQEYLRKFETQVTAPVGSAIIFNSMLLHRAGFNRSQNVRRAVNTVYTVPIIKQQIDLPSFLKGRYADDVALRRMLGYESQSPGSVDDYRTNRLNRLKN